MPPRLFNRAALREIAVLAEDFIIIAFRLFRSGKLLESRVRTTQLMVSWVGATPTMLGMVWFLLESTGGLPDRGASKTRLLWGLLLLKAHDTEKKNAAIVGGVDEGTFATWSWCFLEELSFLESYVIDWEDRKIGDIGNDCMASVDCTDCLYKTHKLANGKPDKTFYTCKYKKSGLRYEVALAILSSRIVWVSGPHLPGLYPDIAIFRKGLIHMLEDGERIEADKGYQGEAPRYCKTNDQSYPSCREDNGRIKARVQRRHETINNRLKSYKALDVVFRGSIRRHSICFRAAAVLLNLAFHSGEQELFDVREYDDDLNDELVAEQLGL